jgi:hypothetical protein
MFADLVEEVIHRATSVSDTAAQRARLIRAQQEGDSYRYQDASAVYEEPAVQVSTANGQYLCFPDHCTCPDWTNRGPVIGTGEIAFCKHQLACEMNAQFVLPMLPTVDEPGEVPVTPITLPDWEPISVFLAA